MNTGQKLKVTTTSSEESLALGAAIAKYIRPGQLIEFVGDLGGGKTTAIKGLAKGLGITKTITSPTFNIQRSYQLPGGNSLEHFDLYRLENDKIILNELEEVLNYGKSIVVVEWAKNFHHRLKNDRLIIDLHFVDENIRDIEISAIGDLSKKVLDKINYDLSDKN
ncbi:MAG: tRNA (adenosine(37)-N6)-threonylcarbamoyltransferase complex ATPase subunit type 1 TsaE [bacterium]|nr:tRNA (adenosine(37)-N6)-threonylcarbamoyltransferase complex ATPase subunit type 1 TsaE [bacterium]